LLKEYKAASKSRAVKAFICFCIPEEEGFEDEIDDTIAAELEILIAIQLFAYNGNMLKVVIVLKCWVNHVYLILII